MTKQQIMEACTDIDIIRLQFTDIFGQLKNVAISKSQLGRALNNDCMFDGSSIDGFARIEESDMLLYPDLDSFLPWNIQQENVARLICDVYTADRQPFVGDPRYILKKTLDQAAEMGYEFFVGPECEFFLFQTDSNGQPTTISHDRGGYFDLGPIDSGENARQKIYTSLEGMGFEIESSHHENAPAQHEIDFKFGSALGTADNIMTFKMVVKIVAQKCGLYATFMPKPKNDVAGSGMHVNMSLFKDGKNIFYDKDGPDGLSKQALNFTAGILKHSKGMTAINNPLVNSYKRLVPGYEAPCYVAWSASNRSPLIRIPRSRGKGTRVELRSPDPSANPYLVIACCLAAGLDGIKNNLTPPSPVNSNVYQLDRWQRKELGIENLPSDLNEALDAMLEDQLIMDTLGPHIAEKYTKAKRSEWTRFRRRVTEWEISEYLNRI